MDLMWPCLVETVEKTRRLHVMQDLNLVWARSSHMLAIRELILLWKLCGPWFSC